MSERFTDSRDLKARAQANRGQGEPEVGSAYRHYKGGTYSVLARAIDENCLDEVVVYLSHEYGFVWTRSLDNWRENVIDGGVVKPRFTKIG